MVRHCWTDHHAGQVVGIVGCIATESTPQATIAMPTQQHDAKGTCCLYYVRLVIAPLISRPLSKTRRGRPGMGAHGCVHVRRL